MELVKIVDCIDQPNRGTPQLMMLEVKKVLDLKGISCDRILYECNSYRAWIWKKTPILKNSIA